MSNDEFSSIFMLNAALLFYEYVYRSWGKRSWYVRPTMLLPSFSSGQAETMQFQLL